MQAQIVEMQGQIAILRTDTTTIMQRLDEQIAARLPQA